MIAMLVASIVFVLLYWLIFGSPEMIYNSPLGLPLQLLLDWTVTRPPNDIPRYHPWRAVGLSVVLVVVLWALWVLIHG
jgi:hypothetical protein